MREKVNLLRHFSILFLTVIVFTMGIFIGGNVEQLRIEALYTQLQEQDLEYNNLVTEGNYLDYLISSKENGANVSCDIIQGSYFTSIENLDKSRLRLENYLGSTTDREDEFQILLGHYANTQINYWVMAERISNLCDTDYNTIIYFFSDDDEVCPECEDQGVHLTYVKQLLRDEVLIFSFGRASTSTIDLVGQTLDISSRALPVLIINGETHGFLSNEAIIEVLNKNK